MFRSRLAMTASALLVTVSACKGVGGVGTSSSTQARPTFSANNCGTIMRLVKLTDTTTFTFTAGSAISYTCTFKWHSYDGSNNNLRVVVVYPQSEASFEQQMQLPSDSLKGSTVEKVNNTKLKHAYVVMTSAHVLELWASRAGTSLHITQQETRGSKSTYNKDRELRDASALL